jgi:hypothetical protein
MFSLLFDVAVLGVVLWGVSLVAIESYWWSLVTIIGLFAGLWFVSDPVQAFILSLSWKVVLLKWLPIYLGVGVGVALVKWSLHIAKTASKVKDARENFKNSRDLDGVDAPTRRKAFVDFYTQNQKISSSDYVSYANMPTKRWQDEGILAELLTPRAKNHLDRISFWVLEWPYVILATIVSDFLLRFGRWIARLFDLAFTRISRFWIHQVVKDI